MRICLILYIIGLMIISVVSIQYNKKCTFSSGSCDWNLGRRWQINNLDDETYDKVLIAIDANTKDKEKGFTDVVSTSWLYLTSSCSFSVRLSFEFNIENDQDEIEAFLIKKDEPQITPIGHWQAIKLDNTDISNDAESLWRHANVSFQAAEEFRVEIEVRHIPDSRTDSSTWFGIDDIIIENCPLARPTARKSMPSHVGGSSWSMRSNSKFHNTSLLRRSFVRLRSRYNGSTTTPVSDDLSQPRFTVLTFILYILFGLVVLSLLIIIMAIIIFTYRRYCLPKQTPKRPTTTDHRYYSTRRIINNSMSIHNSHIDADARTEKTMVTTIRPYY